MLKQNKKSAIKICLVADFYLSLHYQQKQIIMQAYQLHDAEEEIVGTVLVPQGIEDNVHEHWVSFVEENGLMANVGDFADLHGYIELSLDFVQP